MLPDFNKMMIILLMHKAGVAAQVPPSYK